MEQILYRSTRGGGEAVPASVAILNGLAPDGGLYVPLSMPRLTVPFEKLSKLSYQDLAYEVMSLFLTDYTEEELRGCIGSAYDEKFDVKDICQLHEADGAYFLELFHGSTIAFKDMALSILPHLMTVAARKNEKKEEIVILTATSGDTGKAALAGFADVPGTKIVVFYPKHGVSPFQEKQMVTQKGANTCVVGINGNFDDAQTAVKKMFSDKAMGEELLEKGFAFSSANSINIGRLIPQVCYYVYSYAHLYGQGVLSEGELLDVTVPTGNFGNILAAYYAKQLGVPLGKLLCASNENKVLFDFFVTGTYDRKRPFVLTSSPSMDILISSNLERLLYHACGDDAAFTASLMASLSKDGQYTVTDQMRENMADFYGNYLSEEETAQVIADIFKKDGYLIDPHTAVAAGVRRKAALSGESTRKNVVASTASPYKFSRAVLSALGEEVEGKDDFALIDRMHEISGVAIPAAVEAVRTAPVLHDKVVDPADMPDAVRSFLFGN